MRQHLRIHRTKHASGDAHEGNASNAINAAAQENEILALASRGAQQIDRCPGLAAKEFSSGD